MFKKCKAVVILQPGKVEVRTIKLPPVTDDSLVVRNVCSSVSVGTEGNLYRGRNVSSWGGWYPMIPGYEGVGEVEHIGKNVDGFELGERVTLGSTVGPYEGHCSAWGGQVETGIQTGEDQVRSNCVKIPDDVSYEEAVICRLGAVALKGIRQVGVRKGESVLVMGQGVVGMMMAQLAKLRGAEVAVADLYDKRLNISKSFADHTINARTENVLERGRGITDNELFDVLLEATGSSECVSKAVNYVKPGGRIHLQAYYPNPIILTNWVRWWLVTVTWTQGRSAEGQEEVLTMISDGRLKVRDLITQEMPIEKAPEAYELCDRKPSEVLKIILHWK